MAGLFAAQVARNPDAVALVFGAGRSVMASLTGAAMRWRGCCGVVGWARTPRSGWRWNAAPTVAVLLAVLKAGGAYLPVDAAGPAPRVAAMIAAAGARLVLVSAGTAGKMPELPGCGCGAGRRRGGRAVEVAVMR